MADEEANAAAAAAAAAAAYGPGAITSQQLLADSQVTQRQLAQAKLKLEAELEDFWKQQLTEVQQACEFKNHLLPLARIKKIMKSDEDVRMISAEAPVLFAKACEMFILELTYRAWAQTEEAKRRTLQRTDISTAISKTDIFDFLIDIVPREEPKKDDPRSAIPATAGPPGAQAVIDPSQVPHYYSALPGTAATAPYAAAAAAAAAGAPNPAAAAAAAAQDASAAMMYAQNPQQMYANTYASNMAYQQAAAMNPNFVRMQQQMMYGPAGAYPAQYMAAGAAPPGAAGVGAGAPGVIPQAQPTASAAPGAPPVVASQVPGATGAQPPPGGSEQADQLAQQSTS